MVEAGDHNLVTRSPAQAQRARYRQRQAAVSLKFFEWAYKNGDKTAEDLDYVPMPASVKTMIQKSWGEVKDTSGKAVAFK